MKLIGLTGKARAGKDEVAKVLVRERAFIRIALADPLKDAAAAMFGVPRDEFDGAEKEKIMPYWGLSPRQMAQRLGTEAGRKVFGDDLWLKRASIEIQALKDEHRVGFLSTFPLCVVVTDIRFDNEAEWVRRQGGKVVRVTRPEVCPVAKHASENGVSAWLVDATIANDGSLADLQTAVLACV